MSIYYVSTTGSDSNDGLSAGTSFRTLGKVITVEAAGDTCYIAPGWYREVLTVTASGSAGSLITWIGDVQGTRTLSQPGRIVISSRTKTGDLFTSQVTSPLTVTDRSFRRFEYLIILSYVSNCVYALSASACAYEQLQFYGCSFIMARSTSGGIPSVYLAPAEGATPSTSGPRFDHCTFNGSLYIQPKANVTGDYDWKFVVNRCVFFGAWNDASINVTRSGAATSPNHIIGGYTIQHCYMSGGTYVVYAGASGWVATSVPMVLHNNLFVSPTSASLVVGPSTTTIITKSNIVLNGPSSSSWVDDAYSSVLAYDILLEGVHDFAVSKLLADVGVRVNPYAPVLVPDAIGQYMAPTSISGITETDDVYDSDGYRVIISLFSGTVTDPNNVWTSEGNLTSASFIDYAQSNSAGSDSSNYVQIAGCDDIAAFSPETISAVYLRIHLRPYTGAVNSVLGWKCYLSGLSETLGTGTITWAGHGSNWESRYNTETLLTAPSGGWTTAAVAGLTLRMWRLGSNPVYVLRTEVAVVCSNPQPALGPANPQTPSKAAISDPSITVAPQIIGPLAMPLPMGLPPVSLYTTSLGDSDNAFAGQVTFTEGGSITHVYVLVGAITDDPITYNVGLVTSDADTGLPTTTAYGGGANTTYEFSNTGGVWVALPTPAVAVIGEHAYVHVWPTASPPDIDHKASFVTGGLSTGIAGMGKLAVYLTSWTLYDGLPAVAVRYADRHVLGLAMSSNTSSTTFTSASTPNEFGGKFRAASTMTVNGIYFAMPTTGATAGVVFTLYDSAMTELRSVTVADRDVFAPQTMVLFAFEPITLDGGSRYRATLRATASGAGGLVYLSRFTFTNLEDKRAYPGGADFEMTSITGGVATDLPLSLPLMALSVSGISYSEVSMASLFEGFPLSARIIGANKAELSATTSEWDCLKFGDAADESADWVFVTPRAAMGDDLKVVIYYSMDTAASGDVVFQVLVEAIAEGSDINMNTTSSFDTANSATRTVPTPVAGTPDRIEIPLNYRANMAEGDLVRLRLNHDADNVANTATGYTYVFAVVIENI